MTPLLQITNLHKRFPVKGGRSVINAVNGVDLELFEGETLGIVGESGCGKSTLGRLALLLQQPTEGQVWFDGEWLTDLSPFVLRHRRRQMQMVFQDPFASLDPRQRVGDILAEPLLIHNWGSRDEIRKEVARLIDIVGLSADTANRFPHEFSGGQRQRICIARAIALKPKMIVADEPVSALDVSIQSQILNLLVDLKRDLGLSYLFISHDLAVIRHISDRIAVMYLGRVVEIGPAESIYRSPKHPYTQALLSAIPRPDPQRKRERIVLTGDVPSPENLPQGCTFHPRCPNATDSCRSIAPDLVDLADGGVSVACHLYQPA
jgi:oligopeptide/dipeptide ABC transporter ATP-binding protein